MTTRPIGVSSDPSRAVEVLRNGGLVAIPTETVYGLAADVTMPEAVKRIFSTKDRPTGHPLIIHVAHLEIAERWANLSSPTAQVLATTCWPGPLTLLAERGPQVSDIVTGGRPTVGIRVPAHPLTQQLLAEHGGAIAAPSANRFGKVSPTTAQHVIDDIGNHLDPDLDLILDGGPCGVGVESTIIDITTKPAQLLRPGGISAETIAELIGDVDEASGPSRAAGMMVSHYAREPRWCLLNLVIRFPTRHLMRCTSLTAQDLVKAAHELYSELRAADAAEVSLIVALMPPKEGLGNALRDRLTKAAADQGRGSASQVG